MMSIEQISKIANQLAEIDDDNNTLLRQFLDASDKDKWLKDNSATFEGISKFTDKYKNFGDFMGDRDSRIGNLYKDLDGKEPTAARLQSFTDKNPDISADDVKQWFKKANNYKEDELKQREYEYQRALREREVKNLPWYKDWTTSDYSKQRYIDDPTTSVLGWPQFNPYSSEGQSEIRDMLLGAAGAVGDAMPKMGSLTGPAVRALRDTYHKYSDEKYKPEGSIIDNLLMDAGANLGVEYLPTMLINKAKRFTGNVGKAARWLGDVNEVNRVLDNEKVLKESHSAMNDLLNSKIYDDTAIYNSIRSLPESEYKQALLGSLDLEKGGFRDAIIPVHQQWRSELSPEVQEAWKYVKDKGYGTNGSSSRYFYDKVYEPKLGPVQSKFASAVRKFEPIATPAIKIVGGPDMQVTDDDRSKKDWYKANYARDWMMGFKPNEKEGDPLWEAYKEWLEGK